MGLTVLTVSLASEQEGGRQQSHTVHQRCLCWISVVSDVPFNPRQLWHTDNTYKSLNLKKK